MVVWLHKTRRCKIYCTLSQAKGMTGRTAEVRAVWVDLVDLEVGERRHLLGEPVLVFGLGKQLHHFIDGTARDHLL